MTLHEAIRLIYIVDEAVAANTDHLASVLKAGVSMLWLRCPNANGRTIFERALALRALTRDHGRALVIGDHLDVALRTGADGLQAGHRAPPVPSLRPHVPGWLGASCHSAAALGAAEAAGADYATLSPVHAVPGKGTPLGVRGFGRIRAAARLPVVALGGIGPENAAEAVREGADGVAVIRALRDAADPAGVARRLSAEVTS